MLSDYLEPLWIENLGVLALLVRAAHANICPR